ncbi:MAG: tetratricopeptide repeat protein [Pseudomonadota bacterium]
MNRLVLTFILAITLTACAGSDERKREYFERAQAHFETNNLEKARVDVRNALQIDTTYVDARFLFAQIHEQEQNWEQMVANLQIVLEYDENHAQARLKLGSVMLASQAYEQALEQADKVLSAKPDEAEAFALKGAVRLRQGLRTEAIQAAQTALTKDQTNISAIAVLTEVYKAENPDIALDFIEQGLKNQTDVDVFQLMKISVFEENQNVQKANDIYETLISANPDNLYYYYRYVTHLEKNELHDRAESLLRQITQSKPEDVQLKLWLVQYLVNHRDLDQAELALREYIAQDQSQEELHLGLAQVLVANNNVEAARAHLTGTIDEDNDSSLAQRARFALAQLETQLGNTDTAQSIIDKMLEIEPENPDALLLTTRDLLVNEQWDEAIAQGRLILRNRPDSTPALEMIAYAHKQKGASDLAMDNYRQILAVQPSNMTALNELAQDALSRDDAPRAIDIASSALRLDASNITAARTLVAAYADQGELEQALGQASSLIGSSNNLLGLFMTGRVHQLDQNYQQAVVYFSQVLEQEPRAIEALSGLVGSYVGLEQVGAAEQYLKTYIETYEDNSHALELLGVLNTSQGNVDSAQASYQLAIQANPQRASVYIRLGDSYYQQGNIAKALSEYSKGLEAIPNNADLLIRAAQANEALSNAQVAIDLYESALEQAPESIVARNNLAMLYADTAPTEANLNRAASLVREYASRDEATLLDTLGWVYFRLGDYSQAVAYLSRADTNGGNSDPTIKYHLGKALLADGQLQRGKQVLEAAVSAGASAPWLDDAQNALSGS